MSMVNEWQHLKIPFHEIEVATENFKTLIGRGGYGSVFKGKLLVSGKETTVAVKRLNEQFGQGLKEFLTEIQLLSGQQHPNLISLVGYCDEGKEKTIVYEYAERGSLDQYIRRTRKTTSTTLTWLQRLKICTDAARGLDHLHSHVGAPRMIIHRDIKSSNILIDENWVAKISDLGLSKLSVSGFGMSDIISNGCGTLGYCDPQYHTTGFVSKKSDVYSFGVVLFEVLCGRLCLIDSDDGFSLSGLSAKECYKNNTLDKIIDQSLGEHIGSYSMTKFAAIAYRCLHDDREQRPAMDVVVKELDKALIYQREGIKSEDDIYDDEYWEKRLPVNYQRYIEMSDNILGYTTKKELYQIFCHGFLADKGKLWFSICKSAHGICSLLSANKYLSFLHSQTTVISLSESRFRFVEKLGDNDNYFLCGTKLESVMFSPQYTYACYLLFKFKDNPSVPDNTLLFRTECKLDRIFMGTMKSYWSMYPMNIPTIKPKNDYGLHDSSNILKAEGLEMKKYQTEDLGYTRIEERKDGWMEAMLFKPTNKLQDQKNGCHLQIELLSIEDKVKRMIIEGIEFRPYL